MCLHFSYSFVFNFHKLNDFVTIKSFLLLFRLLLQFKFFFSNHVKFHTIFKSLHVAYQLIRARQTNKTTPNKKQGNRKERKQRRRRPCEGEVDLQERRLEAWRWLNGQQPVPNLTIHCSTNCRGKSNMWLENPHVPFFPNMINYWLEQELDDTNSKF